MMKLLELPSLSKKLIRNFDQLGTKNPIAISTSNWSPSISAQDGGVGRV